MTDNLKLGKRGEDEASSYLEREGYSILQRNWRKGHDEIDIVARKNDVIVFVEVKSRTSDINLDEVMTAGKEKSLIRAVNTFMSGYEEDLECRIDFILVKKKSSTFDVIHIEDAITQS